MSNEERLFGEKMDVLFNGWQIIRNWRPNRLKNKKTGRNLEIDYYLGKYSIGFEYQGGVHFKNISKYKNNADKIRYNDLLKYELISVMPKIRKKKPLTIIEIFNPDLRGDFKLNLINRIENNIPFYLKYNGIYNAINLLYLLCFLETGYKFKHENIINGLIPEKYLIREKLIRKKLNNINNYPQFKKEYNSKRRDV